MDQASQLRRLVASVEEDTERGVLIESKQVEGNVLPGPTAEPERAEPPQPRQVVPPRSRYQRGVVIAIASGKGGVGKTSLTIALASALAQRCSRVSVVDADLGAANVDVMCGVRSSGTIAHVLTGERSLNDIRVRAPGGFTLYPGVSTAGSRVGPHAADVAAEVLLPVLRDIALANDVVLLDCGAGVGKTVRTLLALADLGLVITSPEPSAVTDAYALIKATRMNTKEHTGIVRMPTLGLWVNQVGHEAEAQDVHRRIDRVCDRFLEFHPPLIGWSRTDKAAQSAVYGRTSFMVRQPKAKVSRDVRQHSGALLEAARRSCRARGIAVRGTG